MSYMAGAICGEVIYRASPSRTRWDDRRGRPHPRSLLLAAWGGEGSVAYWHTHARGGRERGRYGWMGPAMDERGQSPPPATPGMETGMGIPIGTPAATATDIQATAVGADPADPMDRVNLLAAATGQLVWMTTLTGAVEDSPSWRR